MVQDMTWSGSDGDDVCEESVIFQFGALKIEYFKQTAKGKMEKASGGMGQAQWSRVKNTAAYAV